MSIKTKNFIVSFLMKDLDLISQLVDSTSKGANFIYDILELLSNNFKPNNKNFDFIYIFEMYGFEDFHIVDNSGYSKLIKIT